MIKKTVLAIGVAGGVLSLMPLAQAQTNVVKIGVNEPLSGAFVSVGVATTGGIRLAVKEINDKGGFTVGGKSYRFQLVEADNKSETATAVAEMTRLIEDEKIKYVFGPTVGALAIQSQEVTVPAKAIHFSAATTWQAGGLLSDPKKPLLFGTQNPASLAGKIDAEGFKQLGVRKVAVLGSDDESTKAIVPSMTEALRAVKISTVPILFPPKTTDFSSFVTRAKSENVDGVYLIFPATVAPDVLRTLVELKVPIKGFGGRGLNPELAVKTAVGGPLPFAFFSTVTTPSFDYPANERVKAFTTRMKAFQPDLGGVTANYTLFTHDFVPMLMEAMKRAGTVDDTGKVGQALARLTYSGVAGKICFGKEMRTANLDSGLIFVRGGKIESKTFPSSCK